MRLPEPPNLVRKAVASPATFDLLLSLLALIGGSVLAYGFFEAGRPLRGGLTLAATAFATLLGVGKAWVTLTQQLREVREARDLVGALHVLHALLLTAADPNEPAETTRTDEPRLRATIHALQQGDGDWLVQLTEYVGSTPDPVSRVGALHPSNAGIAGRAIQSKQPVVGRRLAANVNAYREELVRAWNSTRPRAAQQAESPAWAWMAISLLDRDTGEVRGVVFLDSTQADFFTPHRQQLAQCCVAGLADFLHRR